MLAGMPKLNVKHLNRLIQVFRESGAKYIVRAAGKGKPGQPAVVPRALFGRFSSLRGDNGGHDIITRFGPPIEVEVEIGAAALLDVDMPTQVAIGERL
ncbi:hypothetical protein HA462_02860 [Rhizobium leguminosarum bv. trifolii]|jgi:molybdenum cofactor cytidylyltransferase|nr:hypothetical protein HA462_02860 [Rhizobium leguminosarum bv. trifolii]